MRYTSELTEGTLKGKRIQQKSKVFHSEEEMKQFFSENSNAYLYYQDARIIAKIPTYTIQYWEVDIDE